MMTRLAQNENGSADGTRLPPEHQKQYVLARRPAALAIDFNQPYNPDLYTIVAHGEGSYYYTPMMRTRAKATRLYAG